ncbi:MAG: DUF6868 family protein [Thermodesulfobacteriota bacterium]
MTIRMVRNALLWCAIINYGLLMWWFLYFLLAHDWMHRFAGGWFYVTVEQFDAINFAGILFYKISIFFFNIVPCIALYIVERSKTSLE